MYKARKWINDCLGWGRGWGLIVYEYGNYLK